MGERRGKKREGGEVGRGWEGKDTTSAVYCVENRWEEEERGREERKKRREEDKENGK